MTDEIKVGIGGEDTGFGAALEAAKLQSKEAAEQIKASFESINTVFEKVRNTFMAFTAVLAGGEAFKEMIGSTVEATTSSVALGRQLGISATSASQLKVAMASVFVTQDQVSGANQKITMALKKNESAFTDLGVATRDSNGNFRNSLDIQMDVNAALMKFSEGTDRNVEGVKIYGKGWLDAQNTLRMTPAVLEEAKIKADALGLTVGTENVAATQRYRTAMNDVHEVLEAVGKVIAETLMPILSSVGEWFSENGPQVVAAFRASLYALDAVWIVLKGAVTIFVDSLAGDLEVASARIRQFGALAKAALTPGVSIAEAWQRTTAEIEQAVATRAAILKDDAANIKKALADAFEGNAGSITKQADRKEGDASDGGDEKKARLLADLAAELEAKKAAWATEHAARGDFVQFSLDQERAFWEEKTGLAKAGSNDAVAIQKNIDKLTVGIERAAYSDSLAVLKEKESAYKNNLEAKLAIAKEIEAKISAAEEGKGPAVRAAGAAVLAIEREIKTQQLAIDEAYVKSADVLELAKIDAAEREANLQFQLGKTTDQQLLAQDRQFEDQRYALKVQALQRKLALLAQDPTENVAKIAATNQEILALQIQHDAQMDKLRIKAVTDSNRDWRAMFSTMQSGFAGTIAGFMKGTTSLGSSIKGLFQDVSNAVVDSLSKILAQQLINTITGDALSKSSSLAQKEDAAAVAAGNAWKSAAAIPYVGWILGPVEAAAAYAGVMAFGSAEQGYDIPAGINPIMQTHAREMILPAKHADVIRGMADSGAGSAAPGRDININISALDGASVAKVFRHNGGEVSKALRNLQARMY